MRVSKKGLLTRMLPAIEWVKNYQSTWLRGDLSAGLTVGVMLIPQGMAYAMLAGLEPIHGLYAVTVPLVLYALFGSSRQLAVGPVAMVSLLTAAGIASLEAQDPQQYLNYTLGLALMVGLIQWSMGIFRLGFIVNFLSHPVISGFTSAAAIIIGLSQLKYLLGVPLQNAERLQDILMDLVPQLPFIHWLSLMVGIGAIIIIIFGKRIHPFFPGALAAVAVGIIVVYLSSWNEKGLSIVGSVPSGLPSLSFPSLAWDQIKSLFPIAVTISFVGFAESFAIAKKIQSQHKDYVLSANQELIGLGMANFGATLFQGFPVTGGFSRTAVNHQAGAKSGLASLISAGLIVLTLLFLTPLFYFLPLAVLAAVVIVAVAGLVDWKFPTQLLKKDKIDFLMLVATFLSTLFIGIEMGILAGVVLSLGAVIYKASRPHMARLGRIKGTEVYRNLDRFRDLEQWPEVLLIRIDGPLYFANLEYVKKQMDTWTQEKASTLKSLIISMESITSLDSTAAHELKSWVEEWQSNGLQISFCSIHGPVRDVLSRWQVLDSSDKVEVFINMHHAVESTLSGMDQSTRERMDPYIHQKNS